MSSGSGCVDSLGSATTDVEAALLSWSGAETQA